MAITTDKSTAPMPPATVTEDEHWSEMREAGTYFGMRFLFWIHSVFGRAMFSAMMRPVMAYFMLRRPTARQASLQFLRQVHSKDPSAFEGPPGYRQVWQHFIQFGEAILDKALAWQVDIGEEQMHVIDVERRDRLLHAEGGQLLIGSHFGNIEYCRAFMRRFPHKTVNALVYDHNASQFANVMAKLNPSSRVNLYQVDQLDVGTILQLKSRIDNGEWLVIDGDRIPLTGESRSVEVDFLGKRALLPFGPYMLARALQCPVTLMFTFKLGDKVAVDFLPFADRVQLPRKNRDAVVQEMAQRYASELERHTLMSPMQWFNFYDYWNAGRSATPATNKEKSLQTQL